MFYTIYKITNKINGKIYIGKHQTENINDDYLGSGHHIKAAVKKYGRSNFTKEILHVFDNEEQMDKMEILIVNEDFIKRKDVYNISVGGEGGPKFRGKNHTDETKRKLSIISQKPKTYSKESKQKMIDTNKTRIISDETRKKMSDRAKKRYINDEVRNKISLSVKERYKKESECGSNETKTLLSQKMKERMSSKETRENLSNTMKERYGKIYSQLIWVKNLQTGECFRINKNDINKYIEMGFVKGRIRINTARWCNSSIIGS